MPWAEVLELWEGLGGEGTSLCMDMTVSHRDAVSWGPVCWESGRICVPGGGPGSWETAGFVG